MDKQLEHPTVARDRKLLDDKITALQQKLARDQKLLDDKLTALQQKISQPTATSQTQSGDEACHSENKEEDGGFEYDDHSGTESSPKIVLVPVYVYLLSMLLFHFFEAHLVIFD